MILRSRSLVPVIACLCVVSVAITGCDRSESGRESPDSTASIPVPEPVPDVSASDANETESRPNSDLPADTEAPKAPPAPDPAQLHREAFLALRADDLDTAFDLGRQAMRLAPDDPQVIFLMAMILGKRNRFPEAIMMLDELAETNEALRMPVLGQTAEWMVQFGQWSEAERRFRTLLAAFPDSVPVHRNLAQLMIRRGRRIEAATHLASLCRLGDVNEEELRSMLMIVHPFPGDAAKESFDPIGSLGNARSEIAAGDWSSARERLEASDPISPEQSALLGRVYIHLNDFDAAEAWTATVTDEVELHADAWFAKGVLAARRGDHSGAVRCFAETVLRDQTDGQAYTLMSQSLNELNLSDEAAAATRRSELINQTRTLGEKMSSSDERGEQELSELIELLDQLHRPLEALAWRGVALADTQSASSVSESQARQILDEITADQAKVLNDNGGKATQAFILCGVDLDSLP